MARDPKQVSEIVSRRKFLAGTGAAGALALAGCSGDDGSGGSDGGSGGSDGGDGGSGGSDGGDNGDGGSTGGNGGLSGEVVITGSSTVFPISDYMAQEFMAEHPDVNVTVDSTGSGGGFENHFCPGNSDINGASRPIKQEEIDHCGENDITPVEFHIAGDALTMAVNNDNDWVDCMTFDEMSRIWREDGVTNWSDVRDDFPDEPISKFGPASTSGTYDWFLANVVNYDDQGYAHTAQHEPTEEDNLIVQGINDNLGGMGYFGFAYYQSNSDQVKALEVRASEDNECGAPGLQAAADGTYPMARPLFIYPNEEAMQREEVEAFLRFYFEVVATSVIPDEIGYVPSSDQMVEDNISELESRL
jgi:phosphate transport system substrate-binding protein